ncbi:hypothetical protein [Nocardioides montaniterrae]
MKVGWYNVEYGHPVREHVAMILARFERERLDTMMLTEVADYAARLKIEAAKVGYALVTKGSTHAELNQAILVRGGVHIGKVWTIPMKASYFARNGDVRRSQPPLVARLNGINHVVVHAPVHAWVPGKGGRHFTGPIRRRLAYRAYMLRLARAVKRMAWPAIMGPDWNANPDTHGRWSPAWLAHKIGGEIVRPHASTGHGEIDFAITKGIRLTNVRVRPNPPGLPHSDHLLVTAQVA